MQKKKKSKGPTRPRKRGGKAQVFHDLREFRKKLHGWVDRTKVQWTGVPWQKGSKYVFVLDDELVNMVMSLIQRTSMNIQTKKAEELAQERNESLRKLLDQETSFEETPQATEEKAQEEG